jgi:type II secretory pathway component PulF
MIRVGEETGELGKILATLAKFYQREVTTPWTRSWTSSSRS